MKLTAESERRRVREEQDIPVRQNHGEAEKVVAEKCKVLVNVLKEFVI